MDVGQSPSDRPRLSAHFGQSLCLDFPRLTWREGDAQQKVD